MMKNSSIFKSATAAAAISLSSSTTPTISAFGLVQKAHVIYSPFRTFSKFGGGFNNKKKGISLSHSKHFASPVPGRRHTISRSLIGLTSQNCEDMGKSTGVQTQNWDSLLPYIENTHRSVKIVIPDVNANKNDEDENNDAFLPESFGRRLKATISTCRDQLSKTALWIEVPMSRASLIEQMEQCGLKFHHAEGSVANLCIWLQDEIECKIPAYATHQVGVGAVVVNSKDEILCVRELRNNYRPWKLPGGLAELGEQLDEAAIREVQEETGIKCSFQSVLCVRHTHNLQFGRSDLYFVCRLQPIEGEERDGDCVIPEPVAQAGEIAAAKWVPISEYKEMVNGENGHPMMQRVMRLQEQDGEESDIHREMVSSIVPGRKPSPIYHAPLRK